VEVDALRHKILAMPDPPLAARLERDDLIGAVGVFLLVVGATFPVALPFLLVREPKLALMISRALSLGLLFAMGLAVGRYAGLRPVRLGLSMLGIGAILVGVVIALGG
jgi:VIT1/CCC1 family predicted Fe2+/Mn2+ transporter